MPSNVIASACAELLAKTCPKLGLTHFWQMVRSPLAVVARPGLIARRNGPLPIEHSAALNGVSRGWSMPFARDSLNR